MDVLVEFCRTGELAPLRKGMTAAEIERLLGKPERVKEIQGEQHLLRYRYGSLSMMVTCLDSETPDKEHLRLRSAGVSFRQLPLNLPEPIAAGLVHQWTSSRLDDILAILSADGVESGLVYESSEHGTLHQAFRAGAITITAFDGQVRKIGG